MMDEIVTILTNNGASLGCLVYFMYRDKQTNEKFLATLAEISTFMRIIHNNFLEEHQKEDK